LIDAVVTLANDAKAGASPRIEVTRTELPSRSGRGRGRVFLRILRRLHIAHLEVDAT
jgi:hypothetical protein